MIMKAIFITIDANTTMGDIDVEDLFANYEWHGLTSKYQLSIAVKPIDKLPKSKRIINNIGSRLFNGAIIGYCVIFSDIENEIEPFFKELMEKYYYFFTFFIYNKDETRFLL